MTSRISHRLRLVLGSLSIAATAHAQRPIQLVHGLGDDASRWQSAQTRLQQEFGAQANVSRISYTTFSGLDYWGSLLSAHTPDTGLRSIAIGHSAGGLAARVADRRSDEELHGIITIGTPHGGATVVNNRTAAENAILLFEAELLAPINIYWGLYGDFEVQVLAIDAAVLLASVAVYWTEVRPPLVSATAPEMQAGAPYLFGSNGLNSAANLAREASAMGDRRVSIISMVSSGRQICASILWYYPDVCYSTFQLVGDAYYANYAYYSNYLDYSDPWMYQKRANAFTWLPGAVALWNGLNSQWCTALGDPGCAADGLIPAASQAWPGALSVALPLGSAPHKIQPESYVAQTEMINNLRDRFGLF